MRTPSYSHSQGLAGLWIVILSAVGLGVASAVATAQPDEVGWLVLLFAALPPALMLVFGRLHIQLDGRTLEWQFGYLGLLRWRTEIAHIVAVEVTRTTWADGWGIGHGREGWLYNASGFGAVRIRTRDGRTIRLGSDEPWRLAAYITARLPRRQ
jgi:hypothetical protein